MAYFEGDFSQLDPQKINEVAREQGEKFARRIRTNQIRNVYSTIAKIRSDFFRGGNNFEAVYRDLVMLRPKLAYAVGRNNDVRPFQELFDEAINGVINSVEKEKALSNFFLLAESVVAYHKYFGGKD